jgi:cytochrome c-type biogenesis protein CcmF
MVVHIGVIVIAVALAGSNSYTRSATLALETGSPLRWGGHTFELEAVRERTDERVRVLTADVRVDGAQVLTPEITRYRQIGMDVPTPSVDSGLVKDLYVTLEPGAIAGADAATIRAFAKPLVLWMWLGGAVMAIGTLLAAFPSPRSRRATDPVSAPVPDAGRRPSRVPARSAPGSEDETEDAQIGEPVDA